MISLTQSLADAFTTIQGRYRAELTYRVSVAGNPGADAWQLERPVLEDQEAFSLEIMQV